MRKFTLAFFLVFLASSSWAGNICTCGPNTGVVCASASSGAECGASFNAACCKSDAWDSDDDDNAGRSFLPTGVSSIYCGSETTNANACVEPGDISGDEIWDTTNQCETGEGTPEGGSVGTCTKTKTTCFWCSVDLDCGTCDNGARCSADEHCATGTCTEVAGACVQAQNTCKSDCRHCAYDAGAACTSTGLADTACASGGKVAIVNQAVEYCGNDNLRYVIQPRKWITLIDTKGYDNGSQAIAGLWRTVELDTSIPSVPDEVFFKVGAGTTARTIQVMKSGIYKISGQITTDHTKASNNKRDAVRLRLDRCRCDDNDTGCYGSNNTQCGYVATADLDSDGLPGSDCDDGATSGASNSDHSNQTWCPLDGGESAAHAGKWNVVRIGVHNTVFAKLNQYDFIRLRGRMASRGYLGQYASHLMIEYMGESHED